jgi:hypothetical protein
MYDKIPRKFFQYLVGITVFNFTLSSCSIEPAMAPEELTGNYYDASGKKIWVIGIEKQFLMYDSRFWNIKKCSVNQNRTTFRIENEGKNKKISLSITDSVLYVLTDGKSRYILQRKPANEFPLPENKPITMQPGTARISGWIKNAQKFIGEHPRIEFLFNNYITHSTTSEYADIDSLGRFSLFFDLLSAQDIRFNYNSVFGNVFISPGDTLMLYYDPDNPGKSDFQGTHSDVCYNIQATDSIRGELMSPYEDMKYLSRSFKEYRAFQDSVLQKEKNWIAGLEKSVRISETFKYWYLTNSWLDHEVNLLNYGWKNVYPEYEGKYRETYREFHTDILNNIREQDTLLPVSFMFFLYTSPFCYSVSNVFQSKAYIEKENYLKNTHPEFSRSQLNAELRKPITELQIKKALQMRPSNMRDICLSSIVIQFVMGNEINFLEEAFNLVSPEIRNSFYKEQLKAYIDDILRREKEFKDLPVSLMKSNNSADVLLKHIVAENKNKNLILDFWFTGCSACRRDFANFNSFKEELHRQDIEFIYLCYASNENVWKQVVNEFQLKGQHYMLTDDQIMNFKKKFSISGAPNYVLINKAGVVVNSHLHLPQGKNAFFETIRRQTH